MAGGKHVPVHGFLFLQLLVQFLLRPLQVLPYIDICGKKNKAFLFWKGNLSDPSLI